MEVSKGYFEVGRQHDAICQEWGDGGEGVKKMGKDGEGYGRGGDGEDKVGKRDGKMRG